MMDERVPRQLWVLVLAGRCCLLAASATVAAGTRFGISLLAHAVALTCWKGYLALRRSERLQFCNKVASGLHVSAGLPDWHTHDACTLWQGAVVCVLRCFGGGEFFPFPAHSLQLRADTTATAHQVALSLQPSSAGAIFRRLCPPLILCLPTPHFLLAPTRPCRLLCWCGTKPAT